MADLRERKEDEDEEEEEEEEEERLLEEMAGTMHLFLSVAAFLAYVAFGVTRQYYFLYIAIALTISVSLYLGYFRRKMRQHFNIRGSDSPVDDCLNHLLCPCCTLCQETRTLNLNNVRDGTWHGRGDTICIGSSGAGTGTSFELCQTPAVLNTKSPEVCRIERDLSPEAVFP
ncbi:PLANT CADMIUM RESISTANCE 8 protein [Nymphaea thermarum]|nr:PLANT CADMIUM RESISTANCE 8 protein [Nymphaea thermarum]